MLSVERDDIGRFADVRVLLKELLKHGNLESGYGITHRRVLPRLRLLLEIHQILRLLSAHFLT